MAHGDLAFFDDSMDTRFAAARAHSPEALGRLLDREIGRRLGCSDKTACSRRDQAAARYKRELERMKLGDDTSLGAVEA